MLSPVSNHAVPGGDAVPRLWALRELAPFLASRLDLRQTECALREIEARAPQAVLYRIRDGEVAFEGRAAAPAFSGDKHAGRARLYQDHFREAAATVPGLDLLLCASMDDHPIAPVTGVPLFAFQKRAGEATILLPDVDFLIHEFYAGPNFQDETPYDAKAVHAYFVGSMTGGLVTPAAIDALALPRLEAAAHFQAKNDVTFRLLAEGEFDAVETRRRAAALPFAIATSRPWQEQFRYRFLLSMDGNGATCSRLAIALRSRSVLLKYDSPNTLVWLGALIPWQDYVPIGRHEDADTILAIERGEPGTFAPIADAGRRFADTYLNRAVLVRYTAELLALYAGCFANAASSGAIRPRDAATRILAHVAHHGDCVAFGENWGGRPETGRPIEGFEIEVFAKGAPLLVEYRALMEDGSMTEWTPSGAYCGSRGKGMAILDIELAISGANAAGLTPGLDLRFQDGTELLGAKSGLDRGRLGKSRVVGLRVRLAGQPGEAGAT